MHLDGGRVSLVLRRISWREVLGYAPFRWQRLMRSVRVERPARAVPTR